VSQLARGVPVTVDAQLVVAPESVKNFRKKSLKIELRLHRSNSGIQQA
jgi:hypothetical protein